MTKFTKGPWVGEPLDNGFEHVVTDGKGLLICKCFGWAGYTDSGAEVDIAANAHLIAAAPEMYEALKELVRIDNSYDAVTGSVETAAFDAAETALAKAEGKA